MSSIRHALEKLDLAIEKLDGSVSGVIAAKSIPSPVAGAQDNVIDVDFVAARLDRAIATVEELLREEG